MQLSNKLNLMNETDSVDTQVHILTDNFVLVWGLLDGDVSSPFILIYFRLATV